MSYVLSLHIFLLYPLSWEIETNQFKKVWHFKGKYKEAYHYSVRKRGQDG